MMEGVIKVIGENKTEEALLDALKKECKSLPKLLILEVGVVYVCCFLFVLVALLCSFLSAHALTARDLELHSLAFSCTHSRARALSL
jgi:hypothetical protein